MKCRIHPSAAFSETTSTFSGKKSRTRLHQEMMCGLAHYGALKTRNVPMLQVAMAPDLTRIPKPFTPRANTFNKTGRDSRWKFKQWCVSHIPVIHLKCHIHPRAAFSETVRLHQGKMCGLAHYGVSKRNVSAVQTNMALGLTRISTPLIP